MPRASNRESKKEFLAKTITDIGKAILAVGFASYFFERYDIVLRSLLSFCALLLIFIGYILFPKEN